MNVRKAHITRTLNNYISQGLIDTVEIGDLIGKSQRTVQAYLDLTDDREFKATDMAMLCKHFCRIGKLELSYRFLGEELQINKLHIGNATGDLTRIVSSLVQITADTQRATGDRDEIRRVVEALESITADLKAEYALVASRERKGHEKD